MNVLALPAFKSAAVWSLFQSVISTGLIFIFGFLIALGLIGMADSRRRKILGLFFCLPNFVPVLFVVMSFLAWMDFLGLGLTGGFWAVVSTQVLINAGFVGFLFSEQLGRGLGPAVDLARVEGASKFKIWLAILSSNRNEVANILLGVFGLCFTSFSVPLILGMDQIFSFEILAYRLFSSGNGLTGAVLVSALQMALYAMLALRFGVIRSSGEKVVQKLEGFYGNTGFAVIGVIFTGAALSGLILNLSELYSPDSLVALQVALRLLAKSTMLAITVGITSAAIYLFFGYHYLNRGLLALARGVGFVSPVFMGILFYILPGPDFLKLTVGLSLLFFPAIFKFLGQSALDVLAEEIQTARVLGASPWKTFTEISFPRLLPAALQVAAIAGFWAVGDYGFSSIISGEISTLALLSRSLLGGYRIEIGTLVVLLTLIIGLLVFGIFWSLSRVYRQKLID